ncbi:MAG: hypothetical protein ABF289_09910 [Clostridiales bacterium]
MTSLSIVLADYDNLYIENLGNYVSVNYFIRFKVKILYNLSELENYLQSDKEIDILLIDLDMFLELKMDYKIDCIIVLQKENKPVKGNVFKINKYQNIDELIKSVNRIYNTLSSTKKNELEVEVEKFLKTPKINKIPETNKSHETNRVSEKIKLPKINEVTQNSFINDENHSIKEETNFDKIVKSNKDDEISKDTTKIIGVYSVNGGSGKTTIAVGLSIIASEDKKQVFYLNMENFNSSLNFFRGRVDTVAENNTKKNLDKIKDFKLTRCIDDNFNVHYFLPDENYLENRFQNLNDLINYIKIGGKYDYIVIDIDSSGLTRDLNLINKCDFSICVLLSNNISKIKMRSFEKSIKLINSKLGIDILKNTKFVLNKVKETDKIIDETLILKKSVDKKILYNQNIAKWNNTDSITSNKNLKKILNQILSGE